MKIQNGAFFSVVACGSLIYAAEYGKKPFASCSASAVRGCSTMSSTSMASLTSRAGSPCLSPIINSLFVIQLTIHCTRTPPRGRWLPSAAEEEVASVKWVCHPYAVVWHRVLSWWLIIGIICFKCGTTPMSGTWSSWSHRLNLLRVLFYWMVHCL